MNFFKNLNFASSNEDGATEIAALAGATRILSITGSGTRPLDLLMTDAAEIIAFDINPAQNALLSPKLAAIEEMDHAQYLGFLGITDGRHRALYHQLRHRLSPDMQSYWDRNSRMIAKGVWYAGKWEKLLRWNARFLALFRGKAINAPMTAPDVETQARIWQDKFSGSKLRTMLEVIGRDWMWRYVIREPAGEFLPHPKEVGRRLEADFERASKAFLFRESDFATLVFKGRLDPDLALPVYLRRENYAHIKANLSRIRIVEGGLAPMGALGIRDVSGFSLSDFGSYVGPEAYAACWKGIMSAAAPDARFCERIFMNIMDLPFAQLHQDMAQSAHLTATDNAIIYQIRAGTIAAS